MHWAGQFEKTFRGIVQIGWMLVGVVSNSTMIMVFNWM